MATIRDFGIPGVSESIDQPKRTNHFRATFQGIAGGGEARSLSAQVIRFQNPTLRKNEVALHRYNSTSYVAVKHEWEPITMTIEDDIGGRASSVLQAQSEIEQKLIGAGPGPFLSVARAGEDYKFAVKLDHMDGDTGVLSSWIIEGCWLQNLAFGEMQYETGEALKIEVTLRYDHAYFTNYGPAGSAIGGVGSP